MNLKEFKNSIAIKNSTIPIDKPLINSSQVLSERLDEIEKLMLKTECAMKLSDSPYMQKKFRFQYRCLNENKLLNETILSSLRDNK